MNLTEAIEFTEMVMQRQLKDWEKRVIEQVVEIFKAKDPDLIVAMAALHPILEQQKFKQATMHLLHGKYLVDQLEFDAKMSAGKENHSIYFDEMHNYKPIQRRKRK